MKELQKMVEQLRDITNHYATLINSGTPFSVAYSDEKKICTLLDKLIVQVKPYSDNLSTNLTDVRNNLFIHNTNGFIAINSFRFGSLRTIISYEVTGVPYMIFETPDEKRIAHLKELLNKTNR